AVSGNGTIWVVGGFANSIALPGCAQIFTTAARAVFWAKLSPAGVCLSLRGMGGSIGGVQGDFATGLAIALDANNVPAIAGSFRGTLTDPQNPGMPLVSAAMSQDMFVARLDPSDGHVTSKAGYGGVQEDQILGLVFDDGGELYAGGSFKGSVTIPTMPPTTLNSIDPNNLDGVLIRFSSGGTPQWAKRLSGNLHATVIRALTFISSSQAIAFTGLSGGDVTGVCSWPSAGIGTADVFHAAVDKMGNCTYGVPAGANNSAGAYAIDSDSMGRMVSAGEVKGSVNLGPNPPISSPGNDTNGFVARVDWNHGPAVHAVATFGNGGGAGAVDQAFGLTIDKSNFIDVTGSFFNSVSFSGKGVQGQGLLDAFVARYDAATLGITWVRSFGDGASQQGKSVAADPVDNAIVAGGVFQGTLAGAGPSPPVASPGFPDIFVMKLAP
ncbi:MAG: hypothetical protein ABI193_02340, partial [Minicystis sp.]